MSRFVDSQASHEFASAMDRLAHFGEIDHPQVSFQDSFKLFSEANRRDILNEVNPNDTVYGPDMVLRVASDNSAVKECWSKQATSERTKAENIYQGLKIGAVRREVSCHIFFWLLVNFADDTHTRNIEKRVFKGKSFQSYFGFLPPTECGDAKKKFDAFITQVAETMSVTFYHEKLDLAKIKDSMPLLMNEEIGDLQNFCPGLTTLEDVSWTQMPKTSRLQELSARLIADSIRKIERGYDLRFGLREVWFRVSGENFDIKAFYECEKHDLPDHVKYMGGGTWKISIPNAPMDWLDEFMEGSLFAHPICIGEPEFSGDSCLLLEVFCRANSPKLIALGTVSGDKKRISDQEKEEIINTVFLRYINKLNELDDGFVLLSSAVVPYENLQI